MKTFSPEITSGLLEQADTVFKRLGSEWKVPIPTKSILQNLLAPGWRWRAESLKANYIGFIQTGNAAVFEALLHEVSDWRHRDGYSSRELVEILGESVQSIAISTEQLDHIQQAIFDVFKDQAKWFVRDKAAIALGKTARAHGIRIEQLDRILQFLIKECEDDHEDSKDLWGLTGGLGEAAHSPVMDAGRLKQVVQTLLTLLESVEWSVKLRVLEALGNASHAPVMEPDQLDRILQALLKALPDPDSNVRWCAAEALGELMQSHLIDSQQIDLVISGLLEALLDSEFMVSWHATQALGKSAQLLAKENGRLDYVLQALRVLLDDSQVRVRLRAADAMSQVAASRAMDGERLNQVFQALVETFGDEHGVLPGYVASELGNLARSRELQPRQLSRFIPPLLTALRHDHERMRCSAAEALGEVARSSALRSSHLEQIIPALFEALQDTDRKVRGTAAETLGTLALHDDELKRFLALGLHPDAYKPLFAGERRFFGSKAGISQLRFQSPRSLTDVALRKTFAAAPGPNLSQAFFGAELLASRRKARS